MDSPVAFHQAGFHFGHRSRLRASSPDDATELTLSLYTPVAGSDDPPMVVDVGGWAVEDPQALAERGVSVFMAFYPDRWPEFQHDGDPTALRAMAEAMACAARFARGSAWPA